MKFGPRTIFIPLIISIFVFIGLNCFFLISSCNGAKSSSLCDYEAMEVLVYGSSFDEASKSISARISIRDMEGDECAVIERSWKGDRLSVDFLCLKEGGINFCFPAAINAFENGSYESKGKSGINLSKYYTENGRCLLAGKKSVFRQKELYKVYRYVFSPLSIFKYTSIQTKTVDLAGCESGKSYGIFCDSRGNLSLVEL